jgi:GT2 family glycosyltransferase/glycosyltransferase involved in cell wall biosynthesis
MNPTGARTVQKSTRKPGLVSVVVVNYRAAAETLRCLESLTELDWPGDRSDIVCVDNASGDGSAEQLRVAGPAVQLIESPTNTGFAGGCNLGARHARGEYLALINNDARPHPRWLAEAVELLDYDRGVGCVASKVLDWDGQRVDYVGGGLAFTGMAYKREATQLDTGDWDEAKDVLYPTGCALVMRADVFATAGGFDERYFMFFEDVDLGWRLNLMGHRVRYVPTSIVYHKHHAAISKFGEYREQYLLERNALITIMKNFDQPTLDAVLSPALLLSVYRSLSRGGLDTDALDLQVNPTGDDEPTTVVDKRALAGPFALGWLADHLDEVLASRQEIQAGRTRSDAALARLLEEPVEPANDDPRFLAAFERVTRGFKVAAAFRQRRHILVITADTLGPQMAGPAIRAFHIAEQLAAEHAVQLVSTTACTISAERFRCLQAKPAALHRLVEWAEVVIFQGFVMHHSPWLADTDKVIVVDIYDPMHLEQLEQTKELDPDTRRRHVDSTIDVLNQQLARGDFFLCASEEQRHFWLGQLAALHRLNPTTYEVDSSLRSLLAVCPFGLLAEPPRRTRPAIKGVVPGIGTDDKVVLWAGGVYNWFDPLTLIHAIDRLRHQRNNVRLYFLGMKHPNPDVPQMRMAVQTRQLSDELGLTDKYVFFNESWVDYNDRQNYLLDADIGVSTHFEHVETAFSFRTRMLDYLWAGLPIVAVGGDSFGALIEAEQLGVTVPEQDVEALVAALERALFDAEFTDQCRTNLARVRERFVWGRVLEPLIEFCNDPKRAADAPRGARPVLHTERIGPPAGVLSRNVYYARSRLREGGVGNLIRFGLAKTRRLLRRRPSAVAARN